MKSDENIARYISENFMKNFAGNKYLLVNVAAMRARQINDGVQVYVKAAASAHPIELALEEIKQGFIDFELGAPQEIEEAPVEELISFEEMIGFDGDDFGFDDEEPLDMEAMDLDAELVQYDEDEVVELDESEE